MPVLIIAQIKKAKIKTIKNSFTGLFFILEVQNKNKLVSQFFYF